MDERHAALVVELDRVFDRDDVRRSRVVDDVDHRRERRRLAGPRRTGEQHESTRLEREVTADLRGTELFERVDALGDESQGRRERTLLPIRVDAESSETGRVVGEVDLAVTIE